MIDSRGIYLPALREEISQGDIVQMLPLVYAKDIPVSVKPATFPNKRSGWEQDYNEGIKTGSVVASCDFTRAVILHHDCEIDKDGTKHILVALVRQFAPENAGPKGDVIRDNQRLAFFYLPASADSTESYIDLRRVSNVSPSIIKSAVRLKSLSDEARTSLCFQLFRFLTRLDLAGQQLMPVDGTQ